MQLLVHLHLYYTEQADYFIGKLKNIQGCQWKLFITMPNYDEQVANKFISVFPNTEIIKCDNKGADIWPFINLIQHTDLTHYDCILKLHTKGLNKSRVNGIWYKGCQWRNAMVDGYLLNEKTFRKTLALLNKTPKNGMVCNPLFYKKISEATPEDTDLLQAETSRLNLPLKGNHYSIGSTFLSKAEPYKLLQNTKITSELFDEEFSSHSCGTMAHVYERIISLVIYADNMDIVCSNNNVLKTFYIKFCVGILQPLGENLFSIKRYGADNRKYLKLLGIKIPIDNKK